MVDGGCNGSKNGVDYFQCEEKHGLFLPIEMLDIDDRFPTDDSSSSPSQTVSNQQDVNSASNVQSTTSLSQSASFGGLQSGGLLSGLLGHLNLGDSPSSCKHVNNHVCQLMHVLYYMTMYDE